jgi:3-methyladenine DNA glycosylase/8-oxoguanine DNA glycosylase
MPRQNREFIKQYLITCDKKLTPLVESIAYPTGKRNRDIYSVLLQSIVSQQLSVKAADTIHAFLVIKLLFLYAIVHGNGQAFSPLNHTPSRLNKCQRL